MPRYGAFVAATVARDAPDLVYGKRVLLNAPAAVFAPISAGFLYHVLLAALCPTGSMCGRLLGVGLEWLWDWLTGPEYSVADAPPAVMSFVRAADAALEREPALEQMPRAFSEEELSALGRSDGLGVGANKTVLLMPAFEVVTDRITAISRAKQVGIEVVDLEGAGHCALIETPELIANTLAEILLHGSYSARCLREYQDTVW